MFMSELSRVIVRVSKCCKSNKTRPIANSTAEKIRKKNVKDNIFRLSNANPVNKAKAYNVIHNNSAVSKRCNAVFVWIINVESRKKKNNKNVLKSNKNKINLKFYKL
jgi:hypothetical protein